MIYYMYILLNYYHNKPITTQLQIFVFLVMRTFRIYSLKNFHVYNTVLLTVATLLYTPP